MKHTKMFFALLVLAVAVLAFGCTSAAVTDADTQVAAKAGLVDSTIASFRTSLLEKAKTQEIPADDVKKEVEEANKGLKGLGFKIKDKYEGQKIPKDATADSLKTRFTKEKLI